MGNLYKFDAKVHEKAAVQFEKLTFLDKVMACKLLKYSVQATEAYEKFDLKEIHRLSIEFLGNELAEFYL